MLRFFIKNSTVIFGQNSKIQILTDSVEGQKLKNWITRLRLIPRFISNKIEQLKLAY